MSHQDQGSVSWPLCHHLREVVDLELAASVATAGEEVVEFTYKVFIEQIIGVGAAVIGDMSSRPYWGLYELDFVFSTLVVGSILNFSLMYLLAPTAAAAGVGRQSLLAKLFSEQTLKAWGAPGGHMFERGYPFTARLTNLAYKGLVFALVGFSAGIVGTLMSNTLLAIRKQLDPKFESQNKPPNVLLNAGTWATHMGLSSNLRYQLINGLDMVVQPAVPAGVFKLLTSLLRTGNNLLGGVSFVTLAKLFGVQSSAGDAIKTQVKAEHVAVEKAQERADKLPTSPNLHDTDKRKAVKR
ncbi:hypothetical protein WJX72_003058 [[Myrmecia] bisecta]|uniref:Uncharacterized protein n=1 Tax=[Myrmecia] bisecta TaxID=41462 RepID=A0AAW1R6N2_9CHLO